MSTQLLAQDAGQGSSWLIYLLFIIAGLLVGGAYSAHQAGSRGWAIVAGTLAILALAGAIFWLIGAMT